MFWSVYLLPAVVFEQWSCAVEPTHTQWRFSVSFHSFIALAGRTSKPWGRKRVKCTEMHWFLAMLDALYSKSNLGCWSQTWSSATFFTPGQVDLNRSGTRRRQEHLKAGKLSSSSHHWCFNSGSVQQCKTGNNEEVWIHVRHALTPWN